MNATKDLSGVFYLGKLRITQYDILGLGVFLTALFAPYYSPFLTGPMDPNQITWLFLGGIFFVVCQIAGKVVYHE